MTYGKLVPNTDWGQEYTAKDLNLSEGVSLSANMTVKETIEQFTIRNFDQFPVKNDEGKIIGVITS